MAGAVFEGDLHDEFGERIQVPDGKLGAQGLQKLRVPVYK